MFPVTLTCPWIALSQAVPTSDITWLWKGIAILPVTKVRNLPITLNSSLYSLPNRPPSPLTSTFSVSHRYILSLNFIFFEQFQVDSKIEWEILRFPTYPLPADSIASAIINLPYHSGPFVITDEPALTHHHPESIVYVKVH